ncbi:MAG: hypothetical protein HRT41_07510 [Campylobacteraceae bacterium]|nr:hypothetical protein [Campylobacteraceae bacterium]
MKLIFLFFILSIHLYAIDKINVGLYVEEKVNIKNIKFITSVVEKSINKNNEKINISIKSYYSPEKILKDFKENRLKVILLRSYFYFKNKNKILDDFDTKWHLQFGKSKYQQYYLIANNTANTSDIFNSKETYSIISHAGYMNSLLWFDYLKYSKTKKIQKKFEYIYTTKFNKLSNKVFFNKNYLAVLKKEVYESAIELNPQLKRKIKILHKSKNIFSTYIAFTHKSLTKSEKNNLFQLARNITNILDKSRISDSITVQLLPSLSKDDFRELDHFFSQYEKLKKIYLKKK